VASSFRFLSASAQREALTMIVDYDDLTPSEDHLTLTYQGQDFTGTAVEKDRHGTVIAEVAFREGKKFGLSREWFPNGRVRTEETYAFDELHGESREWYESGALRAEGAYELGICLRKQEWSADGAIASKTELREDSPQYRTLQLLRASSMSKRSPALGWTPSGTPPPGRSDDD
jgi:antitoxin component YwqK of YwqJK toxin-antitoxin module